jgi:hypothetical protein
MKTAFTLPGAVALQRLAICACLLSLGACYTVNTVVDAPDANPGDGVCARALTLAEAARAAPELRRQAERAMLFERLDRAQLAPAARERLERGALTPAELAALAVATAQLPRDRPGDFVPLRPGLCTLRAAVMEANAHVWKSTITVPPGTYNLTLPHAPNGAGGSLLVTGSMRLQGSGADATIVDGQSYSSVVYVNPPGNADVELNHLTLRNGDAQAGGGLRAGRGTIEIEDAVIRDNAATTGGAGIAVDPPAIVRLRRSTLRDNLAIGAFGGAAWNTGQLWIYDSTLHGNQSNRAGAIHNNAGASLNLRNVTVSGNRADVDDPSGATGTGGLHNQGFAVLYNVTLTDNEGTADRAGGIHLPPGSTTVIKNSIIAGNLSSGGADDCNGTLSFDSKHNLIGNSTGCTVVGFVSTYLLDTPANIGPLGWNGGPTQTHPTQHNSAARDAGYGFPPPAVDACEARDQRGVPRPQGAGACDMGASEYTSANLEVSGFMLVDAATDSDIRPLRNDDWLILSTLPPQLSIRAVASGATGSVVFGYAGSASYHTENIAPYALAGDVAGNYTPLALGGGQQTLSATPYVGVNGTGAAGIGRTIRFNVLAD